MKYSIVLAATASLVAAQDTTGPPKFTNEAFDVQENKPIALTFTGCPAPKGCTITLKNGASTDLKDYKVLTSTASNGEFTFVPDSSVPSGLYAFEIKDNATGDVNYSLQFNYQGSGSVSSSAVSTETSVESSTVVSTSSAESTTETSSSVESSTVTTTKSTAVTPSPTSKSSSSESSSASESSSSASESESETSASGTSRPTSVPDNGVARLAAPLSLILGAVGVLFFAY